MHSSSVKQFPRVRYSQKTVFYLTKYRLANRHSKQAYRHSELGSAGC